MFLKKLIIIIVIIQIKMNSNNNNNYDKRYSKPNNEENNIDEIKNMNMILNNLNKNIMGIEEKIKGNDNFSKNSDFNKGKIGFFKNENDNINNVNMINDEEDNMNKNMNKMDIDDEVINPDDDSKVLREINDKTNDIRKILSQRKKTLSRLAKFCVDKDISSTLNYLSMINELAIMNDFLNYFLVQTGSPQVPISMDNSIFILNNILSLIEAKYDNYKKVGVHSALIILKLFAERIISTKCTNSVGIDLNKEERIKKCDKIIDIYKTIKILPSLESIISKKNQDEVR